MLCSNVPRRVRCTMSVTILLLGVTACRSPASQRERLASSNPLDQVTAAVWLAESGDATAVHRLVNLLEDRDRTVRMYAILALEHLCGRTYGYRYYEAPSKRAVAVRRWQDAWRRGEVIATPPAQPSAVRSQPPMASGVGGGADGRGEVPGE